MKFSFTNILALALALTGGASANTPISNADVERSLNENGGFDIAMAARPIWHFGQSRGNRPCYPSEALINGEQHGTKPARFPNAGGDCRAPGVPAGHSDMSDPFPTYFTVDRCGENEIRAVYSIYYEHDGFDTGSLKLPWTGHMHDWERIIVVWKRDGDNWIRDRLLKGFHGTSINTPWDSVQNTFDYSDTTEQGARGKDGAKIYAGWAKHANYDTRNTGFNDPLSQGCQNEFRSRDWYYMPDAEHLIAAGAGTEIGDAIDSKDWGSADGYPTNVQRNVCEREQGKIWC